MDQIDELTSSATEYADMIAVLLTTYGLSVFGGIVMLVVGWTVAGWAKRAVDRGLGKIERVDATLRSFFASSVRYVILVLTVLAVLSEFGVQTASLITVFGAASLAIGLALQGTLSNLAAGVMLLFFRPFRVGDYVEAGGHAGTVKAIAKRRATGDLVGLGTSLGYAANCRLQLGEPSGPGLRVICSGLAPRSSLSAATTQMSSL